MTVVVPAMTKVFTIQGLADGVGAGVLLGILDHAGSAGVDMAIGMLDRNAIETSFGNELSGISKGRGALYGFMRFTAPDGSTIKHGPVAFGAGQQPSDPLVSLGYSNKAAANIGAEALTNLQAPAGTRWQGMDFYWATKTQDGVEVFSVDNPAALQAEVTGAIFRQKALPILATKGSAVTKLSRQTELFDEIEDKMRGELRKSGVEARLAGIRQTMRHADALMRKAIADRQAALARADQAKGFQNVANIFGLAANFTNLANVATAQADYAKSEQTNAATTYNSNVNLYIQVIQKNTSIDPQALPDPGGAQILLQ